MDIACHIPSTAVDVVDFVEARDREATSTRPLLSIADGMLILLPSFCICLLGALLLSVLLLSAPRTPLPCPYPTVLTAFSTGFSDAAGLLA